MSLRSGLKTKKMKQSFLVLTLLLLTTHSIFSQVAPNTLLKLPEATTADITLSTSEAPGNMVYSSDENKVFIHTGTAFQQIPIGPRYYVGSFEITGTGSQDISFVTPFQPSSITFVAYANIESANINDDNDAIPDANNVNDIPNSFGGMKGYARQNGAAIAQQIIYNGGNGTSINDISRYASDSHCIGIRYGNQNGDQLGLTTATLTSFNADGFTINTDAFSDGLLVIYEAHR